MKNGYPDHITTVLIGLMMALFSYSPLHGQHTSKGGRFTVDQVKGCAPLTIKVTPTFPACPCDASCPCEFDYLGDGGEFDDGQNQLTFTYEKAGTYDLAIFFQNQIPRTDSITISVAAPTAPDFSIIKCSKNQVTLNIDEKDYDRYEIDFGDGSPSAISTINRGDSPPIHTYLPGSYEISVRGIYVDAVDNCPYSKRSVSPLDITAIPAPILSNLEVLGENSIRLSYSQDIDAQTYLEMAVNGAMSFSPVQDLDTDVRTVSIPGLNTANNYYCFRVVSTDPCEGSLVYSEILCSSTLSATAEDRRNTLSWESFGSGIKSYRIIRNGDLDFLTVTAMGHTDTSTVCGVNYCYRILSQYNSGAESLSLEKCVTATSSALPPPVENLSVSVQGKRAELDWPTAPDGFLVKEYRVFHQEKVGISPWKNQGTTSSNHYTDPSHRADKISQCYQIGYDDACGHTAAQGVTACSILLRITEQDNNIVLSWNIYEGWSEGVLTYILDKIDASGQTVASIDVGLAQNYRDNSVPEGQQIFRYRLRAKPRDTALTEITSNVAELFRKSFVSLPNSFTPNGDGNNDTFHPIGRFIQNFEMKIFNRWGHMVFHSHDIGKGWDGTSDGGTLEEGTYAYSLNYTDQLGKSRRKAGTVLLIRR